MSLNGVKYRAYPEEEQKRRLSQWMGAARFTYNGKVREERENRENGIEEINCSYAQLRTDDRPWMNDIPGVVFRNAASKWYFTHKKFERGICGRPTIHPKKDRASIYLTSELFEFVDRGDGVLELYIGTKKHPVGKLVFHAHRAYKEPKSVTISKCRGKWFVSFNYEDGIPDEDFLTKDQWVKTLKTKTEAELNQIVVGIDRGVSIPVQCGDDSYNRLPIHQERTKRAEVRKRRYQRQMARRKGAKKGEKTSNRRAKARRQCSINYERQANIRKEFAHQTSRKIVDSKAEVFVMEHLRVKNMTSKPKPKKDPKTGKWMKNGRAAKAGLNKAILAVGWGQIETFVDYKARKAGKVLLKVNPAYTSQECAACGHIHPDNRLTQANFVCVECGHTDNADHNAALVIKKRAIKILTNPGAGLSAKGVLIPGTDTGRGGRRKTKKAPADLATSDEPSKVLEPQGSGSPSL